MVVKICTSVELQPPTALKHHLDKKAEPRIPSELDAASVNLAASVELDVLVLVAVDSILCRVSALLFVVTNTQEAGGEAWSVKRTARDDCPKSWKISALISAAGRSESRCRPDLCPLRALVSGRTRDLREDVRKTAAGKILCLIFFSALAG